MKCKMFRDKLQDYLDNNLHEDMYEAMSNHIKECPDCKKLYDEELEIEELFISAMKTDDIEFNSSRQRVLKSIDKNLYGKSPMKKIKFAIIRNRVQIIAASMLIAVGLTSVYVALNIRGDARLSTQNRKSSNSTSSAYSLKSSDKEAAQTDKGVAYEKTAPQTKKVKLSDSLYGDEKQYVKIKLSGDAYVPDFKKDNVSLTFNKAEGTPWKKSPDGSLELSVYGKGENAAEEGEAYLLLKNSDDKMWKIYIANNKKQYTPMKVEWMDDNNVLATVGLGYGTVTVGGDLFIINVNSGKAVNLYNVYTSSENKNQIFSIGKEGDTLELRLREYKDDILNKYIEKTEKLYFKDLNSIMKNTSNDSESAWREPIDELSKYIGVSDTSSISGVFDEQGDSRSKADFLSDMSITTKLSINRIIDITPSVDLSGLKTSYPYIRSYIVEMDATLNETGKILKNGSNYLYVTLVSKSSSEQPLIYSINTMSQN